MLWKYLSGWQLLAGWGSAQSSPSSQNAPVPASVKALPLKCPLMGSVRVGHCTVLHNIHGANVTLGRHCQMPCENTDVFCSCPMNHSTNSMEKENYLTIT